jgi:hypothetical protein
MIYDLFTSQQMKALTTIAEVTDPF